MHCDICGIGTHRPYNPLAPFSVSDLAGNPVGSLTLCLDCLYRYAQGGRDAHMRSYRATAAQRREQRRAGAVGPRPAGPARPGAF